MLAKRDAEVLARSVAQRIDHAEELVAGDHRCLTQGSGLQNILAPDQHLQSLAQMPQALMRMMISRGPATGRAILATR